MRDLVWRFYRTLKSVRRKPSPGLAAAFHKRFARIFSLRTGYHDLDKLLARLFRRKDELLKVLERPDTPLHTNASENDLRSFVTKRKISGGTVSRDGRVARHTMLGLMKTCRKLGLSFWRYLGDRIGLKGQAIPPLAALVAAKASACLPQVQGAKLPGVLSSGCPSPTTIRPGRPEAAKKAT
ncbi:transposase [Ensifer sp. ENS06]|uniref:IS66 family transposase n=1 Tax=Ensifer sp. ENS06 TaxID=2769276 RepID=UPI0028118398|nr:transposase [Ensifer sp. ENS06]